MNTSHAPSRCDTRAIRIARVKFVALPIACSGEALADADEPAAMPLAPMPAGLRSLISGLRAFVVRVIARLEAARP